MQIKMYRIKRWYIKYIFQRFGCSCIILYLVFGQTSCVSATPHDMGQLGYWIRELRTERAAKASFALSSMGDSALPSLHALLHDKQSNVRYWVVAALGWMESDKSINDLIGMLQDPDWSVRVSALLALTNHVDARIMPPVKSLQSDPAWQVRAIINLLLSSKDLHNTSDVSRIERVVSQLEGSADRLKEAANLVDYKHYWLGNDDFRMLVDLEVEDSAKGSGFIIVRWFASMQVKEQRIIVGQGLSTSIDYHKGSVLLWKPKTSIILIVLTKKDDGSWGFLLPQLYRLSAQRWVQVPFHQDFSDLGSFCTSGDKLRMWDSVYDDRSSHYSEHPYRLCEYTWSHFQMHRTLNRTTHSKYFPLRYFSGKSAEMYQLPSDQDPLHEFGLKWR